MKKLIIVILIFYISYSYGNGTRSGVIMNYDSFPVTGGIHLMGYADSSSLSSLNYNPAFVVTEDYYLGVSSEVMPLTMYSGSLGYVGNAPFGDKIGMGGMIKYFSSGDLPRMNNKGEEIGSFQIMDFLCSAIIGKEIQTGFYTGIRVNFINETILESESGLSIDGGAGYKTVIFKKHKLNLGLSLLNIGTKIWGENLPVGIGSGVMISSRIPLGIKLEYGIGGRWCSGIDWEAGPSIRINHKIKVGIDVYFKYKIGLSYTYREGSKKEEMLDGLKTGIFVESPLSILFGYELVSYPWGMGNKLFLGYKIK